MTWPIAKVNISWVDPACRADRLPKFDKNGMKLPRIDYMYVQN